MTVPTNAVVLGIGADGFDAALAVAIAEARRTQRPLHLVHVLQLPPGDAYVGVYGGVLDAAKATLDGALAEARTLAGSDVPVTGELMDTGWVVDDLVRRTDGASLLVMQHRALSRVKRVFVGSMVHGVAGRAHVPVLSVPEGWDPTSSPKGVVTVAVQDPVEAPAILRSGFTEARDRGARLVVLHAWWLASGFDVVVVDGSVRDEWAARSREEMQPVLAPLQEEFPDVDVTIEVRHAPPVEAVLDAGEASDVLVLGRRHHRLPIGTHLGPVVRAALDHGSCPVLVTPELRSEVGRSETESRGALTGAAAHG
ncbi:universal stress protein [Nocardioides halotolerans]|uniref:universal stress protein n=1 Tax=Nocardioides halotolerans TaxID=433660 RepID=UPI0003FA739B|nr:universal stress protein [Nocardioides halotolerans]